MRADGNIYSRNFPWNDGLASRVYINLVPGVFESSHLGISSVAKNPRKPEYDDKLMHFLTFFSFLIATALFLRFYVQL